MKFKMNDCKWEIVEIGQDKIRQHLKELADKELEENPSIGRYCGCTYIDENKIYIDVSLPNDRKRNVLIHELTHCYIQSYMTHSNQNYNEENVCDISANSHDIIHKIVEDYFRYKKN